MRLLYKLILTFVFIGAVVSGMAQTTRLKRANELYNAGGYFEAIELYKKDLDKVAKEEMGLYLQKIANAYRFIGNPKQAEIWYGKAIARSAPDPKVLFYYAEMLKMNEKYDDALEQYLKYKEVAPNDQAADTGIESCDLAIKWKETPSGYDVTSMRALNSRQSDFSPAFGSEDYTMLYFTSTRDEASGAKAHAGTGEKFADIFVAERDRAGKWSKPRPLDETINTEFDEGTPSLTPDYLKMFFTRCRTSKRNKLGCEILFTEKREQGWLTPESLPIAPDSMVVAHPSISSDELTLYFVSNIKGGMGGNDIWRVTRASASDSWGEPVNLGPQINSKGNEMFPFIHRDGTLYFSTDGQPGMGGLDIFKAKPLENGTWEVENMRYPINSPADDFGIIFEKEREAGYFSSRRQDVGSRGDDNLYLFFLPSLNFNIFGEVKDEKTGKLLARAAIKIVGSDGNIQNSETAEDGSFRFILNPNTDYIVIASKEGYLNNKAKETTKGITESKDFKKTIALTSTARPIELPNIFYDFNRWELRPESMASLDRLVEVLTDNPTVIIELGAHTDSRGTLEYNYELSQKRAQSVVNYLIEKGIPTGRLRARGYAQSQPKVVDEQLATQFNFLKIGDILNPSFIDTLTTEEQKEAVYQINRRTEFRVLSTEYKP